MNRPLLETIIEVIKTNEFQKVTSSYEAITHITEDLALLITKCKSTEATRYKINILGKTEKMNYNQLQVIQTIIGTILEKDQLHKKIVFFQTGVYYEDVQDYIFEMLELESELIHTDEPFLLLGGEEEEDERPRKNKHEWTKDESGTWVRKEKTIFSETNIQYWKDFSDINNGEPIAPDDLIGIFIYITLE